jgi:hypothetical protein
MATDGADFKRRVKYHGKTYTEIKNGSALEVVAGFSVAGLARELAGENPILGFGEMVDATVDCLPGILARDGQSLLQDLKCRLDQIAARSGESEAQRICRESLVRVAGALRGHESVLDSVVISDKILIACGRDLHDSLVIGYADQYAMTHRNLTPQQLHDFLKSWQDLASPRLAELIHSIYQDGRPAKEFLRPRPELVSINSNSMADLTSVILGS